MKLRDFMPSELTMGEFHDTRAYALRDVEVISERRGGWPGKERNVEVWCVLANGRAVGFNENPSRGWSFPVIKFPR